MGVACGECVVFVGWPAYGGRAFAGGSRGICGVYMGGVWAGFAWYWRGGTSIRGGFMGFAWASVDGRGMRGICGDMRRRVGFA